MGDRTFEGRAAPQRAAERPPSRRNGKVDLSPGGVLGLQRSAGNTATTAMVQRLVNEAVVRSEAERLWIRKGRPPGQTQQESQADWDLATRNVSETEAEAQRLWQAKGSPAQSDVDQQRDWADAHHTIRQRRLAEDIWQAKGAPQNQTAAASAADWATAGDQLEIEQLWERCNPTIRLPGEDPANVATRVTNARNALAAKPGFQGNMIDALLTHDHGRSPRPFVSVASEDALGLGGHIVTKHVRAAGVTADGERYKQAMRVVTHAPAWGGNCPGKAGSFASVADADSAVGAAMKKLWSERGGWGAPDGWRNRLAKAQPFGGALTVTVPINGFVQEKNPHTDNHAYPAAQRPAYLPSPHAVGNRPLYPGDPTPFPPMKNGVAIVPQPGNPLTVNVVPTQVYVRVVLEPGHAAAHGWYINSAWPQ